MRLGRASPWRPAGAGLLAHLFTRGGATHGNIESAERQIGSSLPVSLAAFLLEADAAEGWVGGQYLAMWPVSQLGQLNARARIADRAPQFVAFATDGGGEGFFFDRATHAFVNSPLIGLGYVEPTTVGSTFDEFLSWLVASVDPPLAPPIPDATRFGLVIHEITPILFGGDPIDPANKVLIPLPEYLDAVAWWNEQLQNSTPGTFGSN